MHILAGMRALHVGNEAKKQSFVRLGQLYASGHRCVVLQDGTRYFSIIQQESARHLTRTSIDSSCPRNQVITIQPWKQEEQSVSLREENSKKLGTPRVKDQTLDLRNSLDCHTTHGHPTVSGRQPRQVVTRRDIPLNQAASGLAAGWEGERKLCLCSAFAGAADFYPNTASPPST